MRTGFYQRRNSGPWGVVLARLAFIAAAMLVLAAQPVLAQDAGRPALRETVPTINPGDGPEGRIIAFMLQAHPAALTEKQLRDAVEAVLPAVYGKTGDFVIDDNADLKTERDKILAQARDSFALVDKAEPLLFRVLGVPILVVPLATPLPNDEFTVHWQDRRTFPDAAAILGQHTAHSIIFALGEPGTTANQVTAAEAVSAVSAAYAKGENAIGVDWSSADLALTPKTFHDAFAQATAEAEAAEKDEKPIKPLWHRLMTLWIDIRPVTAGAFREAYAGDDGKGADFIPADVDDQAVGFVTRGLQAFVGREIELVPSSRPAHEQALVLVNLLAYLLDRGQVMSDHDTIGFTAERKIMARLLPEGQLELDRARPVLRLTYIADLPDQPAETGAEDAASTPAAAPSPAR